MRLLMKLAGGGDLTQIDTAAFLEQAAEYEGGGDLRDSFLKLGMTAYSSHPVPVARAAELRKWIDSGEYARILGGDYPRRDGDGNASVSDDVKAAADSYREAFNSSQDPLVGAAAQVRWRRRRPGRLGRPRRPRLGRPAPGRDRGGSDDPAAAPDRRADRPTIGGMTPH